VRVAGSRKLFARRAQSGPPRRLARAVSALVVLGAVGAVAWFSFAPEPERAPPEPEVRLPRVLTAPAALVRVVDGDTLKVGEATVRLAGLDAPERGQICQRADGTRFDCGEAAARQLAALVQRRGIACDITGRDRYGRAIGLCRAEGLDLAEAMVASGWALAVPEGSRGQARYGLAEAQARSARQGLWEGRFQSPESWRRGQ
jgi:endonuclease YncB( thermonuclease family)